MRMLLLTIDFPPQTGGVARYLDALATYFRDEITVVAPKADETNDEARLYKVQRETLFGSIWPTWFPMIPLLLKKSSQADVVVVSHVLPVGTAAMIASWLTKKPYAVIVHGLDVVLAQRDSWKNRLAGLVLQRARVVVTNSRALEAEVQKEFGVKRTVVVYPVTALPEGFVSPRNDGAIRLLTVARLVERKGHVRVLQALAQLRDQKRLGSMRYEIIGNGPMFAPIEDAIKALGLSNVVSLTTVADDVRVAEAYASSDLFVMPTMDIPDDREGFGMVYIEAAMRGIPSIASRLPGVDEAVLDGKTGLLVPDGDIEALANAIYRLATDKTLRSTLGQEARRRALAQFKPEIQFEKLRRVLP